MPYVLIIEMSYPCIHDLWFLDPQSVGNCFSNESTEIQPIHENSKKITY